MDQTEHRVRARRHGKMAQQPGTGVTTDSHADPSLRRGQPAGAPGMGRHQFGQPLGKRAPAAFGIAAVEPAYAQAESDPATK